jgi:hypothetical protein
MNLHAIKNEGTNGRNSDKIILFEFVNNDRPRS